MEHNIATVLEFIYSIIIGSLFATLFFVLVVWTYFLLYLIKSLRQSPILGSVISSGTNNTFPKVSIIVPARNEEKYIGKCLTSLLEQDYPTFEILAVNDLSSDTTGQIMNEYRVKDSKRISVINIVRKPDDWVGKNWACYQGYLKSSGEVLIFTDADTVYSRHTVSLAVGQLIEQNLDALTARPTLLLKSVWRSIIFPLLWAFSHISYSALRVNDPKNKTAYLFGCFYVVTRHAYDAVGTHEAVKNQIIEDAKLGEKIKEQKFRLKMVRGEHHVKTVLAGDFATNWQGLRRSINLIPLSHRQHKINALPLTAIATFFLLIGPYILVPFSILLSMPLNSLSEKWGLALLTINLIILVLMVSVSAIPSSIDLFRNLVYTLASPMASLIIFGGLIVSIVNIKKKKDIVSWKGRQCVVQTFK
ncbi:MAG TPA: glycosyltransferase [Candidatus Bathyarchaeia archaeon]|nr:glycosyltransferase [Candidatus Bathyarchaeia archaeon]